MADSTFSIAGLVSGLDFNQIIDQLIQVESRVVTQLETRKLDYEGRLTAFQEFNSKLLNLMSAADKINRFEELQLFKTSLSSSDVNVDPKDVVSVTASDEASPGSLQIEVTNKAEAQSISSGSFTSTTSALSLSGAILINGRAVEIQSTDTLDDIKNKVNSTNTGTNASQVSATIISVSPTDNRLVITSTVEGQDKISILDASAGTSNVLQSLGFTTASVQIKNQNGALVESDRFSNTSTTIGTLYNLSSPNSGTVQIKGVNVSINLATDSLTDIRDAINNASIPGVTASIASVTEDETTTYKLQLTGISGVGDFVDAENILESLGVIEGVLADQLNAGADAALTLNGSISVTRSTNVIDDLVEGVTINILSESVGTTITVDITRDTDKIKGYVQDFIDEYNNVIDYINEQQSYNSEAETGGILQGDPTLLSIKTTIRDIIATTLPGLSSDYDTLSEIGIKQDKYAKLSIDSTIFDSAISTNFNALRSVLIGEGTATDPNVTVIGFTNSSEPGTYSVNVTQAASQSSNTGTVDLSGGLGTATSLTITRDDSGRAATINFNAGDDIDGIVSALNSVLNTNTTEVHTGNSALTDSATSQPITDSTVFANISGANVQNGDTITIGGTDRFGNAVSDTFTISDASTTTVRDLLSAIESAFAEEVVGSINSSGQIVITDVQSGDSQLSLTLTENNEGGGTLDFGSVTETTAGRYGLNITASKNGSNQLVLTADDYGSSTTFTVVDNADLGISQTNLVAGTDVAGTINGEAATGSGQLLSGDSGDANIDGVVIRVEGTTTGSRGTVTLSFGIMERMVRKLDYITNSTNGAIESRTDGIQDAIDDFDERIGNLNERLTRRREQLTKQFVNLEVTLSTLQSQSSFITSALLSATFYSSTFR